MRDYLKDIFAIGLVTLCSMGLLSIGYEYSQTIARAAKDDSATTAYLAVIPDATSFTEFTFNDFPVYEGWDGTGKLIGLAFCAQTEGFGGPIELMIGVAPDTGRLIDIQVVSQTETPGLGDRICESAFTDQFKGKSVEAQFEPGEDIDAVSGATISSSAVAQGVKAAVDAVLAEYRGGERK